MEGIDDALMAQLAVDGYSEDMGSMMGSMDEADMMEAMKAMQSGGMPPGMGGGGSSALAGPPSEVSLPAGGPDGMGRVTMEEIKKWVEIYPCYLCENLDPRHGRRLPKSKLAGLTDVRWNEIASSAVNLGFRAVAEPVSEEERAGCLSLSRFSPPLVITRLLVSLSPNVAEQAPSPRPFQPWPCPSGAVSPWDSRTHKERHPFKAEAARAHRRGSTRRPRSKAQPGSLRGSRRRDEEKRRGFPGHEGRKGRSAGRGGGEGQGSIGRWRRWQGIGRGAQR